VKLSGERERPFYLQKTKMINQRKNEIKVGIVTVLGLLIFFVGMTLVRGCNVSLKQETLKIRFPNSGGIQLSNPVVVNGVKRGKVTTIKNDKGSVLVEVLIDDINDIYSDATAKITILEITGGKKIEINPGTSGKIFNPENEMPGETSADIASLFILVGDVSNQLIHIVNRLDTLTEKFTLMADDKDFTDNLTNIVSNTDEMIANANSLLKQNLSNINIIIGDIRSILAKMNNGYDKYEPRLDTLVNNLNLAINKANSMMISIDTTITRANGMLSDAGAITSEIRNGSGTISKLIYDKNLALQMDSTIINLNALMELIRKYGVNVNVRLGTRP